MKKNKKILIASHGSLAKGMLSSLNIIIGKVDNIETLCGYLDADFNLEHSIDLILSLDSFQDNTLETKVKEDVFGVKYINPMVQEWTNLEDV